MELEHNILGFGVLGCLDDLTPTKGFGLWVLNICFFLQDEVLMHEVRTKFFTCGSRTFILRSISRLHRIKFNRCTADDDSNSALECEFPAFFLLLGQIDY